MSAIGIDLGGTAIKYAVVEQNGNILWEHKKPTEADKPTAHIVQNIIDAVLEAREQAIALGTNPVCVGIGTPGIVDVKKGFVVYIQAQKAITAHLTIKPFIEKI